MDSDTIHIRRLRATTTVGVPEAERAQPQEVEISLRMIPKSGLCGLGDQIANTVDYYEVTQRVLALAESGQRLLIETLAEDIGRMLMDGYPLAQLGVEIRKFVLPETEYVSVQLNFTA